MSKARLEPAFEAAAAVLRERFGVEHGDPGCELRGDYSGCSFSTAADGVRRLIVGRAVSVFLLWIGDRRIRRMPVGDVADGLAQWWCPGEDDMFIVDTAWRWAVLLDHEARLWSFDA